MPSMFFEFILFLLLNLLSITLCQSNYSLLFPKNLTSETYLFKSGVLDHTSTIIFATARSITNLTSHVVAYKYQTGVPIFLSSSSDPNNNQPVQYDTIDLTRDYLLVSNTLQQILAFNSSDGSYIATTNIKCFYYGKYLQTQNIYIYSTTANSSLNITPSLYYLNLSNPFSNPILIDNAAGASAYMFFSQNQTMMGYISGTTTTLTIRNTSTWAVISTFPIGFHPTSGSWGVNDTHIWLSGGYYFYQGYYNSTTITLSKIVLANYGNAITTSDCLYSPLGNYQIQINIQTGQVNQYIGATGSHFSDGYIMFKIANLAVKSMKGYNNANFLFFTNINWTYLTIFRAGTVNFTCNNGYYINYVYDICSKCQLNCLNCESLASCSQCNQISTLYNGTCCLNLTQYFNFTSQMCQKCSSFCSSCQNPNICTVCQQNYYLSDGYCCPQTFIWNVKTQSCQVDPQRICNISLTSAEREVYLCGVYKKIASISTFVSRILISTPFAVQALTFMTPFFMFCNDFWMYNYHNRNYTQLIITATFLEILSQMNANRILSPILDNTSLSQANLSKFFKSNYSNYTFNKVFQVDQKETYFIKNTQQLFIFGWIGLIGAFIFLNFLKLSLTYLLNNENIVTNFLAKICSFHTFIQGLIETNSIFIVFYAFRQFSASFSFKFYDKLNFFLSVFSLFGLILYSGCYYPLIAKKDQSTTSKILKNNKKKKFNYWNEPRQTLKCVAIGAVHALLLPFYKYQISTLIAMRSLNLALTLWNSSIYSSKTLFTFNILYSVLHLLFDLFLMATYYVFESNNLNFSFLQNYHTYIEMFLVIGIVIIILVKVLINIALKLHKICSRLTYSNKISDKQTLSKGIILFKLQLKVHGSCPAVPQTINQQKFNESKSIPKSNQLQKEINLDELNRHLKINIHKKVHKTKQ